MVSDMKIYNFQALIIKVHEIFELDLIGKFEFRISLLQLLAQ